MARQVSPAVAQTFLFTLSYEGSVFLGSYWPTPPCPEPRSGSTSCPTQHIRKTSWRALHRVIYTTSRLEFLLNRLVSPTASGPQGPRASAGSRSRDLPTSRGHHTCTHRAGQEELHESSGISSIGISPCVLRGATHLRRAAPGPAGHGNPSHAHQWHQHGQRQGRRSLLPAGTRVHGVIGTIQRPKQFAIFRGQAYMNLTFKSIEIDSRLIPVQMSLLAIGQPRVNSESKRRHDVKIVEGEVVQEKHDYKGDALGMAVGGGGGSAVGLVFSNVARGFGIGFAAGAIYVVARKGKEVEMPAQTGMLARLDSTVTVPYVAASNDTAGGTSNSR